MGKLRESATVRCVLTLRDNLRDLFNGAKWLTWQLTKRRLNSLHAQTTAKRSLADHAVLFATC
jgi:hypothetical protein